LKRSAGKSHLMQRIDRGREERGIDGRLKETKKGCKLLRLPLSFFFSQPIRKFFSSRLVFSLLSVFQLAGDVATLSNLPFSSVPPPTPSPVFLILSFFFSLFFFASCKQFTMRQQSLLSTHCPQRGHGCAKQGSPAVRQAGEADKQRQGG